MSTLTNMTPTSNADKEKLVTLLHASRERFLASFAGVTDDESRRHPAEGRWSVLDCVEHVAGAERGMLRLLQGPGRPRPAGAPNREQVFLERIGRRDRKVEAPEGARPRGRFANLDEALERFEIARAETIRFIEESTEDLRGTEATHPLFGDVSSYEMLIIMAGHVERHALQIEEIKQALLRNGNG